MSEWRGFVGELRSPKSDVVLLLTTFGLTVLVDLTVAIEVGMVLAAFLFMRRMASVATVNLVTRELEGALGEDGEVEGPLLDRQIVPDGVEVFEINGPFFFGAVQAFSETLDSLSGRPKVLIIRMRHVPAIDSTGMRSLRDAVRRSRHDRTAVLLTELHTQPRIALQGTPTLDEIGEENIFETLDEAIERARALVVERRA